MTRSRTKAPITSFGPEILSALIAGSKAEVRIELPYRHAVKMRQRLYQLRLRMRDENHEAYTAVARCYITILWGKDAGKPAVYEVENSKKVRFPQDRDAPSVVVIKPQDSEFKTAVNKAGIETPELTSEPLAAVPGDDILESYLDPKEIPNG